MREVSCNLCGKRDARLVYVGKDRLEKLPGEFRLVQCNHCGLLYLNPQPDHEEIKLYYPPEYGPYQIKQQGKRRPLRELELAYGYWKRVHPLIQARPQGGRVLDVGCSTGGFLDRLRRSGPWEVHGVDVSADTTKYVREHHGIDAFNGELEDAHFPDGHFDVVTMWDVLEHVHDVQGTIAEVRRILKPGGLFLVRVPNAATWDAKLFGPYWAGLDMPRHLTVFTPLTLGSFLREEGFQVSRMQSLVLSYHPIALSVQFVLDEKLSEGPVKRLLSALNNSKIPRLLTVPLFAILTQSNRTFATTAFATKIE